MSQQMNILCCFSCNIYQVHIVKTSKKWQCKICNKKQPFRQIFFQGSGKDCRVQVQKLNAMKEYESQMNPSFEMVSSTHHSNYQNNYTDQPKAKISENKWAKYLDTSDKDLFNAVENSNHEYVFDKAIDDSVYSNNDNSSHGCSQSSNIYSNFDQNDTTQIVSSDDEAESPSFVEQEISHTILTTRDDNKSNDSYNSNTTETNKKNIFDDNEDFDLVIDF
ncbi:uncharacterized protein LOC116426210 [Nomia melanderi]|uniref:uncharacterized protein LOC116426210 n=1 Tax=Nomia melanderi TaxID=2448451 RepID=UPI001303F5CF|nr:MRN complex-interacting protein [Nomia melanderi]